MKIAFALGNPGDKYEYTRHNLGILQLKSFLDLEASNFSKKEEKNFIIYKKNDAILLFSQVFMNLSFSALSKTMQLFKVKPCDIIVLHDDLMLKEKELKLKEGGGHAGHNGLRDIIQNIGSDFFRLRIGIDHPKNLGLPISPSDYVLSKIPNIKNWDSTFESGNQIIKDFLFT
jgi:peptidyl-tRNA hydrolase, PTH1 family